MSVSELDAPICSPLTHKQAVKRIAGWMKMSRNANVRCSIVFAELVATTVETPDVIGWSGGRSVLVECKVSRADFLADKKKSFRRFEEIGMGNCRYFATPKGLLNVDEIPEGWGLLEIADRTVNIARKAETKTANKQAEVIMLCSAIRRLEISTAVFVQHEENAESTEPLAERRIDDEQSRN